MTKRILLALAVAVLPACATLPTTSMVECPESGCDPPPPTPEQQVIQRASPDLQCAPDQIRVERTDANLNQDVSRWEARGCGRTAMYRYYDTSYGTGVSRDSPVVASPFK